MKAHANGMVEILTEILDERLRAFIAGFDDHHDDQRSQGELPSAAIVELMLAVDPEIRIHHLRHWWPWTFRMPWAQAPRTYRERLVRAGQYVVAELERLNRAEKIENSVNPKKTT